MSPSIQLSATLYQRLEGHAQGFDTPENVIERLLNAYEMTGGGDAKPLARIFHQGR